MTIRCFCNIFLVTISVALAACSNNNAPGAGNDTNGGGGNTGDKNSATVPKNVTGSVNDEATGKVKISWAEVEGARSYTVYWKTDVTAEAHLDKADTTELELEVSDLEVLQSYYFVVTAHIDDVESKPSIYTRVVPVKTVTSGKLTWLDRNLGASRVCEATDDTECFGDLYQWGRLSDGHQKRDSETVETQSEIDRPGHTNFIHHETDWRQTANNNLWKGMDGINNPCPTGFRLPTLIELERERELWQPTNASSAFSSPLKLPVAGLRKSDGTLDTEKAGYYWVSTIDDINNNFVFKFDDQEAVTAEAERSLGYSVRCVKHDGDIDLDPIPSYIPQNVRTNPFTDGSFSVSWGDVPDAGSYVVYWHTDDTLSTSNYTGSETVSAVSKTFREFTVLQKYYFAVTSKRGDKESKLSNKAGVTVVKTVNIDGTQWLDRNLGASKVCESVNDTGCYGDLYQWSRGTDGHEKTNSETVDKLLDLELADDATDEDKADRKKFVIGKADWRDTSKDANKANDLWQKTNSYNPCPPGFRPPTGTEWTTELNKWDTADATGAAGSQLRLPMAGYRNYNDGVLHGQGQEGNYWSSVRDTSGSSTAQKLFFGASAAQRGADNRAYGYSVRCLFDN